MKKINYVIKDSEGIHARPAGELVKLCKSFLSDITIETKGKSADAKRIFGIMSLAAKMNDEVVITVDGEDEERAVGMIEVFLKENL